MTVRSALRSLVAGVFLLLSCGSLWAQQGTTVSGTLTNTLSHDTIANATVTIEELSRSVKSGPDGRFAFDNVPPGRYHLVVRGGGFLTRRTDLIVAAAPLTSDVGIDPELHYSETVSVSPESRSVFESYQPTTVLAGQELQQERQGTLGETLQYQPGIALRSFGPGPARPVIRGLDGDRVLVLEDGQRMGDLSSQSGDHGVNVNPASASRMEVVRGPATLLYGANAIGGLVNVITNEIPTKPVSAATGSFTVDLGSAAEEAGGAGELTVGNGSVALHVSASGRRAGDYNTPEGEVPNSFNRSGAGEIGLAWTGQNGYFGASYAFDRAHYGIPLVEDGNTNLDPRRQIFNVRAERRAISGVIDSFRASLGVRRYRHDELAGDEISTSFKNDTSELELLASQRPAGKLKGSFGASFLTRAFVAAGEEVLSPPVDQKGASAFLYEEVVASPNVSVQFGGRVEHASFDPTGDEPRTFTNFSGSLGLLVHPSDATTVAFSFARAARNPALEELYFHGPHGGNFAFENGDTTLESERALGFDMSVRWHGSRATGEITYFFNNINNFIFRRLTGALVEELPETFFTAGDARLQGIESHIDLALTPVLFAEGGLDYVRGELTSTNQDLPRMPPLRGRLGLRFHKNAFQIGADGVFTGDQNHIFSFTSATGTVGETPTPGYNLLKLFTSYSFTSGKATSTITARLDNATDELYHNHLNYLKDLAPEIGRNFKLLYSVKF